MKNERETSNQGIINITEERFRRDLVIVNNPVLVEGLALTPIIGAAVTLQNAVMLSVMVFFMLIPTRFIGNLLVGIVPQRLRSMVYAIIAGLCYIPGHLVLMKLFGFRPATLGFYLPLLVVDSIIISRTEIPQREKIFDGLVNGITASFGFLFAATVLGIVREFLGAGRFAGKPVTDTPPVPLMATAAGGFIAASIFCAILQYLISVIKRARYRSAKDSWYPAGTH